MDELIRSKMHDALDVAQPDAGLRYRVMSSLPASERRTRLLRAPSLDWVRVAVAVLLAVAVVAGLLYVRGAWTTIPGRSSGHAVAYADSGMSTPTVGWATSASSVLRTIDGGHDWSDVTPAGYHSNFVDTYFLDGSRAWLTEYDPSTSATIVFRTTDGGTSWQQSRPISASGLHRTGLGASLFFIDATHGWLLIRDLVADSSPSTDFKYLYRTSDAGATWGQVSEIGGPPNYAQQVNGYCFPALVFSSMTMGWIANWCPTGGGPALLVSRDGGATWGAQSLPVAVSSTVPGSLVFFDSQNGILEAQGPSTSTKLLATSDGGQTWNVRTLPGAVQTSASFVDANHGWAIGGSSDLLSSGSSVPGALVPLYRTADGGRTWAHVKTDLLLDSGYGRVRHLEFVDQQNGFAFAQDYLGGGPGVVTMLRTADGGATWTVVGPVPAD